MQGRTYAAARQNRLTAGWQTSSGSADAELLTSLTILRSRSRALIRDAAYAKRARVIVQNNVVGSGIGMQAQVKTTRNALNKRINDAIEREWDIWTRAQSCHTGGALAFQDLERMAMGEVVAAGEIFIRKHYSAFGDSKVPFALEVVEAERLADEFASPGAAMPGAEVRIGVEVDSFGRALAYWIRDRHPGDIRFRLGTLEQFARIPATQIQHLRVIDRWPQTRGEPWLHAVARKLNDMDGYTEAEIVAARGAASYMGFIQVPDMDNPIGEPLEDGTQQVELSPGLIGRLGPGETFEGYAPNRPNSALDPFLRYMLREFAAGINISYESVSKDYSQSNYSSSRLSLLDDRDVWRVLQQWFIRAFREPIHHEWLDQAVLAGAIPEIPLASYLANREVYRAVLFKPRGWSWIDPTKEVEAAKEAVRAGFTTTSRVIAATADGADVEDIIAERMRDDEAFAAANIKLDTEVMEPAPAAAAKPSAPDTGEEDSPPSAAVLKLKKEA